MRKPTIVIGTSLASLVVVSVLAMALGADRMVSPEFLVTSLVVVLIPGTGVVYTVSSAMAGGRNRGFIAAVGCRAHGRMRNGVPAEFHSP